MTDRRTGMPLDRRGKGDKQGQGPQGFAGERSEDRGVSRPDLRRAVDTGAGTLQVEESSGTAFAEATGAADRQPPDPPADGGAEDAAFPINAARD